MRTSIAVLVVVLAANAIAGDKPRAEIARYCWGPKWQRGGALLACGISEGLNSGGLNSMERIGVAVYDRDGKLRHFIYGAGGSFAFLPDGSGLVAGTNQGPSGRLLRYSFTDREVLFYSTTSLGGLFGAIVVAGDTADPMRSGNVFFTQNEFPNSSLNVRLVPIQGGGNQQWESGSDPDLSSDGSLAYRKQSDLETADILIAPPNEGAKVRATLKTRIAVGPRFSPDGRWLALVVADAKMDGTPKEITTSLRVFDLAAARDSFHKIGAVSGDDLAWSPDSREIAASGAGANRTSKIVAFPVGPGKPRDLLLPDPGCSLHQPAWTTGALAVIHTCAGIPSLRIHDLK